MNHWYVVQTKPKREDKVQGQLSKAGFEVFLPKMRAESFFKPLFPSYLFVNTNFEDHYQHRMVKFTRGVLRILGDCESPVPIPPDIVFTLKDRTLNGSVIEQELLFRQGDEVRVRGGILKDLIGIIEKNLPEKGRVQILFKWIFGQARASLSYRNIERI